MVEITKKLLGCSDPWRGDQDQLPPVAAGGEQLGALVEDGGRLVEHDVPLLQEAEAAGLGGGVVASAPVQDGPGDGEGNVGIFELPHILAESGALGLVRVPHVSCVTIVPLLKCVFSEATIGLDGGSWWCSRVWWRLHCGCHLSLVHQPFGQALAWERTLLLSAWQAVAALVHHHWSCLGQHLVVVLCQDLRQVGGRPVRHLDVVFVEAAPEDVIRREALLDDVHEDSGDVCER